MPGVADLGREGLPCRPSAAKISTVRARVAVIGEAVVDAFVRPHGSGALELMARPGGGPANTAVTLSRLGTPTQFFGRLARGPLGDLLRRHLEGSGVDLSASVDAAEEATLAIAAVGASGDATYSFYATGTADWQWTATELAGLPPRDVVAVHTGSLALALDPGGPVIEQAMQRCRPYATISIDPNLRPRLVDEAVYGDRLPGWARLADILRLSEDDLVQLRPGVTDGGLDRACDWLHGLGARLVIITRGAAGALASYDGDRVAVRAVPVETVDTVGAGDAFTGAVLHCLSRLGRLGGRLDGLTREDLERALSFAALVAGRTCQVPGADPPWASELPAEGAV
jgi:fructokinase